MAFANRIKVTTATTGTGALTLSATGVRDATNGDCLAPAEVLSELGNRSVSYTIQSGASFAQGTGMVSADGLTLARDPNEVSWNGTTYGVGLLTLSGTSTVMVTPKASDFSASSIGLSSAIVRGAVSL
jgi:hypothetical protein